MFSSLKTLFLDLCFPRTCLGCGKTDTWICEFCWQLVKTKSHQECYICRKVSSRGQTCARHHSDQILNGLLVATHYGANPLLKKALKEMKYHHHPEGIAKNIGSLLYQTFDTMWCEEEDLIIIPVPLHPDRQKKRGFNQSELLAQELRNQIDFPHHIDSSLLLRQHNTLSQVENTSRQDRLKNLKNAFICPTQLNPYKVYLLIDDVVTTGATLEECCKTLRKHGAIYVWGLVGARN